MLCTENQIFSSTSSLNIFILRILESICYSCMGERGDSYVGHAITWCNYIKQISILSGSVIYFGFYLNSIYFTFALYSFANFGYVLDYNW